MRSRFLSFVSAVLMMSSAGAVAQDSSTVLSVEERNALMQKLFTSVPQVDVSSPSGSSGGAQSQREAEQQKAREEQLARQQLSAFMKILDTMPEAERSVYVTDLVAQDTQGAKDFQQAVLNMSQAQRDAYLRRMLSTATPSDVQAVQAVANSTNLTQDLRDDMAYKRDPANYALPTDLPNLQGTTKQVEEWTDYWSAQQARAQGGLQAMPSTKEETAVNTPVQSASDWQAIWARSQADAAAGNQGSLDLVNRASGNTEEAVKAGNTAVNNGLGSSAQGATQNTANGVNNDPNYWQGAWAQQQEAAARQANDAAQRDGSAALGAASNSGEALQWLQMYSAQQTTLGKVDMNTMSEAQRRDAMIQLGGQADTLAGQAAQRFENSKKND